MSKFVEINTDYVDDNGVQHIDGYTSNSDDAEGCVVAYFVKGEAYYTNPDYQFDELVKATIAGLKAEYNKTAQGKYKHVIDTAVILQLPETAVSDHVLNRMYVGEAFTDKDKDLNEKVYYGSVFESVLEQHTNGFHELHDKFLPELNDLIELCKEYQYVMITKV